MKEVQDGSAFAPSSVMLSAYGFYDGTERNVDGQTVKGKLQIPSAMLTLSVVLVMNLCKA